MKKKKSFLLYADARQQVELLTDAEAGSLCKALYRYADLGELPQGLTPVTSIVFSFLQAQMERDREKYEQICAKRAICGRVGAAVAKAHRCSASEADTDTDTDNEPANEPVTDPDTDIHSQFLAFWEAYPFKSDMDAARDAFDNALEQTDIETMLQAIAEQRESAQWQKAGGLYVPKPSNWLRKRRWLDKLPRPDDGRADGFARHDSALTPLEKAAVARALAEGTP